MNQPDLGKKILELRKAKGLTQEELVEMCNLNVRTLQRIESGEVTPRSYTMRVIFAALGFQWNDFTSASEKSTNIENKVYPNWLEQFYLYFIDLFNLKTHTMKKISILTISTLVVGLTVSGLHFQCQAQTNDKVKKIIDENNKNFVRWYNSGKIDSLSLLFDEKACLVSLGCGRAFIKDYYEKSNIYKFREVKAKEVKVDGDIAKETGYWAITTDSGKEVRGNYYSEWHFVNNKWLITSDVAEVKQN